MKVDNQTLLTPWQWELCISWFFFILLVQRDMTMLDITFSFLSTRSWAGRVCSSTTTRLTWSVTWDPTPGTSWRRFLLIVILKNCDNIKDHDDDDSETRDPVFMFNKKWYSIDCDDNRGVKDVTIAIFYSLIFFFNFI